MRSAIGLLIGALAVAGLVWLIQGVVHVATQVNYGFLSPLGGWLWTVFGSHLDGWVTAVATVALFLSTWALTRASQAQVAGDSPFLRYRLSLSESPLLREYFGPWAERDAAETRLTPYLAGPAKYIGIEVYNEQTKAYGVALDVSIGVSLSWGAADDINKHPFQITDTIVVSAIGASQSVAGAIFNVGTLPNYLVEVTSIAYSDVLEKRRSGGYGQGQYWQKLHGVPPVISETVFKPTKREMFR